MSDWAEYSREVQAASDAGWKQQKAEIDALKKQLREAQSALRAEREKALREAADLADTTFDCSGTDAAAIIRMSILALIPKDGEKP